NSGDSGPCGQTRDAFDKSIGSIDVDARASIGERTPGHAWPLKDGLPDVNERALAASVSEQAGVAQIVRGAHSRSPAPNAALSRLAGEKDSARGRAAHLVVTKQLEVGERVRKLRLREQIFRARRSLGIPGSLVKERIDQEKAAGSQTITETRKDPALEKIDLDDQIEYGRRERPCIDVGLQCECARRAPGR